MISNETKMMMKLAKCMEKITKSEKQVVKLIKHLEVLSDKRDKEMEKITRIGVKYRELNDAIEAKAQAKAVKAQAKAVKAQAKAEAKTVKAQAKAEAKAVKAQAKAEAKAQAHAEAKAQAKAAKAQATKQEKKTEKYIPTENQIQIMSQYSNEYLIDLANKSEISTENLLRITGQRMNNEHPRGWSIPMFTRKFIQDFGTTEWVTTPPLTDPANSISSLFYRMSPESETSRSKITGKLSGTPSFAKTESRIKNSPLYLFDANLYLNV